MNLRVALYGILAFLVGYVTYSLPKKLMIVDLEYRGKQAYPHATYSNNLKLYSAITRLLHNGSFICSSVVVSEEYALTAAHCVSENGKAITSGYNLASEEENYYIAADVAYIYGLHDIAVLHGDFSAFNRKSVDFSGKLLNKPEGKLCGYPQGQRELYCSDFKLEGNRFFFIQGTGHLFEGMSGGPLLVEDTVLGVNSHVGFSSVMSGPVIGLNQMFEVF